MVKRVFANVEILAGWAELGAVSVTVEQPIFETFVNCF